MTQKFSHRPNCSDREARSHRAFQALERTLDSTPRKKRAHQKPNVARGPVTWSCKVLSRHRMEAGLGSGADLRLGEKSLGVHAGKEGVVRPWRGRVEGRGLESRAVPDLVTNWMRTEGRLRQQQTGSRRHQVFNLGCWVNARQENSSGAKFAEKD